MKKNNWIAAFALYYFFVGLVMPGICAFIVRDWVWLIVYLVGFVLLVVGILVEERKR